MAPQKQDVVINSEPLQRLLSRVSLEGSIEQCVLTTENGVGTVNAIDMTNSIFLSISEKIAIPDSVLGLCDLSYIIRLLSQGGEFSFSIKEGSSFTLKKKGIGTVRFTLMEPGQVPTAVPDQAVGEKIVAQCKTKFALSKKSLEKVEFHTSIFPSEVICIVGKNGCVYFTSSEVERNCFSVQVGPYAGKDFSTQVYSGLFMKALKSAFSPEDTEKIFIFTGENMPAIVYLNGENYWAITPIVS